MIIVCFGFGYFVWLIDEFGCGILTGAKNTVGLPLAFLFEFHGWYVYPFIQRPFTISDGN